MDPFKHRDDPISHRPESPDLYSQSIMSRSTKLSTNSTTSSTVESGTTLQGTTTLEPILTPILPLPVVSPPAQPSRTTLHTTFVMVALCTTNFLSAIDTVILTTALPTIAQDLGVSTSGFAWIGSSFLLANAASMPIWAQSSDIFGRKPLLLLANSTFAAGSLISALSNNFPVLLVGRVVQGLGCGGLSVLVNIIVSDLFAMRMRGLMLGLLGAVWSLAAMIGPVTGGVLAEEASWRWCFWLNIPFNIACIILLTLLLKLHNPQTPLLAGLLAIDWLGALTLTTGTTLLLLGLQLATVPPSPSPISIVFLLLGPLSLLLFPLAQSIRSADADPNTSTSTPASKRSRSTPLIPFRIFSPASNTYSLLVCASHGTCYIAIAYFLPFYLQSVLLLGPLESATWSLVTSATLLLTTLGCGFYMHATRRYIELILVSFVLLTLGLGLFTSLPDHLSPWRLVVFQILAALGTGGVFQSPLVALQSHLPARDVAAGTATFGLVRMLSAGFSLVLGDVIYQAAMRGHVSAFLDKGIAMDKAVEICGAGHVGGVLAGLTAVQRGVVRRAQTGSLGRMWVFYAVVAGLGGVAALGVRGRMMSDVHVEMKTGIRGEERESGREGV